MTQKRVVVVGIAAAFAAVLGTSAGIAATRSKERAAAPPATAPARVLGTDDGWSAYVAEDRTGRVCYLVGQPTKSAPAGAHRQPPSAMVTHRPAERVFNVVSFVEGYPLRDGSDVALEIGRRKFALFTNGDAAWARTSDLDHEIVDTLAKAHDAVVKGVPQRGPATTDTYTLAGFSKALALIDKACGVKR